jgi:exopolysaccharide production protein ExoQ
MDQDSSIQNDDRIPGTAGIGMAFAVGFFFSLRWILSLFAITVLGADTHTGGDLSLILNFFLLGLVCIHALGAGRYTFTSMLRIASLRWVMAFLAFSLISLAWSGTASLTASLVYWCAMAADVAMVVLLLRAAPAIDVASSLLKGFIWSTCLLAIVVWIMPLQPDLRLGNKDYFNTNQIASLCAFAIFLAQYLTRRKDGHWNLAMALLAITLLRSLSKATLAAFFISQSFLLVMDRSVSRRTKVLLTLTVAGAVLISWGLIESYYVVYTNEGNQAETLTGRLGIWAYLLDAGLQKPWIGHGFNSIWKVVPAFGVSDAFEARHAENDLLQQFYAYGIVGIALLAGLYTSLYRQLRRLSNKPLRMVFLSLLLFIVVRGLAEAEPFDPLLPLWAIVLFGALIDQLTSCGDQLSSVATSSLLLLPVHDGIPQSLSIDPEDAASSY